ncbi:MAG: hypothetical protein IJ688_02180 [Treponema sp.]|nr:hypothetical protein [Treponema sp.]
MKSILTNTIKITLAAVLAILCAQPLPDYLPLQWRKWISAMAMDSVLISHFLSFGKTSPAAIKNEVLLFVLGVGFGILVNLLLHKKRYLRLPLP